MVEEGSFGERSSNFERGESRALVTLEDRRRRFLKSRWLLGIWWLIC